MTTLTINIPEEKANLVKQLLIELGVTITKAEERRYDPKFVAKIKKADEDIEAGRTKKIATADLWK